MIVNNEMEKQEKLRCSPGAEVQNPRSPTHKITLNSRKKITTDYKTIYPTPVFEEVLPRFNSQNVEGQPPATPGENRWSVGKDTVKRRRSKTD